MFRGCCSSIVFPIRTHFFEPVNNINEQKEEDIQVGHLQHCFSYTRFAIVFSHCVLWYLKKKMGSPKIKIFGVNSLDNPAVLTDYS